MKTPSSFTKIAVLLFGTVEFIGAALWCIAGAGIYGSPLPSFEGLELVNVWAFLIVGPGSALAAGALTQWRPRWGAIWLIAAGLVAGLLALPFIPTDAGVIPLLLSPIPMIAAGVAVLLTHKNRGKSVPVTEPRRSLGSIAMSVLLFLVAWVGMYAILMALVINNVNGLRGEPEPGNPWRLENEYMANTIDLLLLGSVTAVLTIAHRRLRLRWEFIAGLWCALLLGLLVFQLQ